MCATATSIVTKNSWEDCKHAVAAAAAPTRALSRTKAAAQRNMECEIIAAHAGTPWTGMPGTRASTICRRSATRAVGSQRMAPRRMAR
eukprot:6956103-Pyramimonas_sp.AAC.1